MNGDAKKIFGAIEKVANHVRDISCKVQLIEERQQERHDENKQKMKELSADVKVMLPVKTHVTIQWFFIGGISLTLLTMAFM